MQSAKASLLARDDTFLGVCEGLGEDLRIPPFLLRVGFAGLLFWNPIAAIGTYLGLGLLVALTRWLVPDPAATAEAAEAPAAVAPAQQAPAPAEARVEPDPVPLAA